MQTLPSIPPPDDLTSILVKLIQQNPLVGVGATFIVALWWIGKNDKEPKSTEVSKLSEDELIIALAKIRAKKASGDENGRLMVELKRIIDLLEKEDIKDGS